MLARFFLLFYLVSPLLFATHVASSSTSLKPYLVTVILNEINKEGFYHCYIDQQGKIWMPAEELRQLGFPDKSSAKKHFQNKTLIGINQYQDLSIKINTRKQSLQINTPIYWEKITSIPQATFLNGRIRPEQAGFFLIMILLIAKLIYPIKTMEPAWGK